MPRAKRTTKTYSDKWKLTFSDLADIPISNQRVADTMRAYMNETEKHDIRNLERAVMDSYEEERVVSRFDCCSVKFKWICIAKQHCSPYAERWAFAIYSGRKLLAAVFENSSVRGSVVERGDYEAI